MHDYGDCEKEPTTVKFAKHDQRLKPDTAKRKLSIRSFDIQKKK